MDEIQTTVGQNTGSPATETQTAATQTQTQVPDSAAPQTTTEKMLPQSEVDRIVNKRYAEWAQELGGKPSEIKAFLKAVRDNPKAVAKYLGGDTAALPQTNAAQPSFDNSIVESLGNEVVSMRIERELDKLASKYDMAKDDTVREKVTEFVFQNNVPPEVAFKALFADELVERAKKGVVESIKRGQNSWLESGNGPAEADEDVPQLSEEELKIARRYVKMKLFKNVADYAKSLKR